MFTGDAAEAIDLYQSLFDDFEILSMDEKAGEVAQARIRFAGQEVMVIDSKPVHDFHFTPSMSIFVECDSAEDVDRLFGELSEFGSVLMALGSYPFAARFAWVQDRFGLSWQLRYRDA